MLVRALSQAGVWFMRLLAHLPLPWVRALGWALGGILFVLVRARRRVVLVNLSLCFPQLEARQRKRLAQQTFILFAQAWLDRSWLWFGAAQVVQRRLHLSGNLAELQGADPTLIFAPHFVGMDAGWTALTQQIQRRFITIYTPQSNLVVDDWVRHGRARFGQGSLFLRSDGVKPVVTALRANQPLYLLPDMDFGAQDAFFVPFYGVPTATLPSLARFAKLARAKVVPVVTRLVASGYRVEVLAAWPDFPSDNLLRDTALMNQRLQSYIDTMPGQYYWVHKRFKDRPSGAEPVY